MTAVSAAAALVPFSHMGSWHRSGTMNHAARIDVVLKVSVFAGADEADRRDIGCRAVFAAAPVGREVLPRNNRSARVDLASVRSQMNPFGKMKQRMPSGAPKVPESETGGTRNCSFTPSAMPVPPCSTG